MYNSRIVPVDTWIIGLCFTDLDVDEAHDEGGEDHREDGEPVAGLAVGRVDVAL